MSTVGYTDLDYYIDNYQRAIKEDFNTVVGFENVGQELDEALERTISRIREVEGIDKEFINKVKEHIAKLSRETSMSLNECYEEFYWAMASGVKEIKLENNRVSIFENIIPTIEDFNSEIPNIKYFRYYNRSLVSRLNNSYNDRKNCKLKYRNKINRF